MIGHSQRNFRAVRIKRGGVERLVVRLGQAPKAIAMITLHFLVIECDSKYIINQNTKLSTKKLAGKKVCTLPLA